MALEGTLDDFSLADIFQLIGIQRKTGILTLKNVDESVTVTFHNGMVIGADSVPKKLEDRIGKVLVKTGLISPDQLKEALDHQKKTMQKIGFILIDQKYISKDQLKEALQIQVTQTIYRLFRWSSGEYYFDQKTRVDPNSDESIAPVSAESILMEGIHMIDEWPVIRKRIPDFQLVFRRLVQMDDLDLSGSDNGSSEDSEKIRLGREEQDVFFLVDGHRSVAEIIDSSKFGEFHTCKGLYDLLERKVIEPVGTASPIRATNSMSSSAPILTFPRQTVSERKLDYMKIAYLILPVIILISIAWNLRDPLRLVALPFSKKEDFDVIRTAASHSKLRLLDSAVLMYYQVNGILPYQLEDLVEQRYVRAEDLLDPWARAYVYEAQEGKYMINGHTPDGKVDNKIAILRIVSRPAATPAVHPKTSEESIKFLNPE